MLCGLMGLTLVPAFSNEASAATDYPAPVLNSAKLEGDSYVLSWSLPSNPNGTPTGGYDIVIDGTDTNKTWRTTGTSRTISGLDPKVAHTFQVEARWLQADPYVFPRSNELTATISQPVASPTAEPYPAPVLESAKLDGGNFVLSWSLPSNPTGTPTGGYDIVIDGTDTNKTWRTTGTSRTISGLDPKVAHTFQIEARWLQADPYVFPRSNELNSSVTSLPAGDTTAPTVAITSPSANTTITSAQTLTIVAGASDNTGVSKVEFYNGASLIGTDTTNTFSTDLAVTEADNGTHNISAIAYDAAGNTTQSAPVAVTVDIATAPATVTEPYPAPVLNSVKADGGNMVLSWSLPSNPTGTPTGGYDIVIDGTDTNKTWRTTGTKTTITGLKAGVEHTFVIEARWLQADPYVFPRSNQLSGTIAADSSSTDSGSTDSGSTDSGSTDSGSGTVSTDNGPLRAFPGAQGFGTETVAGRGGKVIRVTNLSDSGTGSLRAALTASGPRIVIFDVSGTIEWFSNVTIKNPNITVAGQTAPFPGITVRGAALQIDTHDVLIQHLRTRVGDRQNVPNPDGIWVQQGAYNIVVDHCSLSWGIDENASISPPVPTSNPPRNITFSNTIFSEGLFDSVNDRGTHSRGFLLRQSYNVSLLRNLFAHNDKRNPEVHGSTKTLLVNNVIYNAMDIKGAMYFSNADGKEHIASLIGNVGIPGPNTPSGWKVAYLRSGLPSGGKVYAADNRGPGYSSSDPWAAIKNDAGSWIKASTPPISISGLSILPGSSVESHVLKYAGARPAERDAVDARVTKDVANRTGRVIDCQDDVGGWPKLAYNVAPLVLPSNPNGDDNGDGFTNLEELLHQRALKVEGRL
jgi:pectate lyase